MTRRAGPAWAALLGVLLFTGCLAAVVLRDRQARWEDAHPLGVIAAEKAYLYKGDGTEYPRYNAASRQWIDSAAETDASALPVGAEARLLFERGAWVQIRLPAGEVGWVSRTAIHIDRLAHSPL
jgi:hypothetical protein